MHIWWSKERLLCASVLSVYFGWFWMDNMLSRVRVAKGSKVHKNSKTWYIWLFQGTRKGIRKNAPYPYPKKSVRAMPNIEVHHLHKYNAQTFHGDVIFLHITSNGTQKIQQFPAAIHFLVSAPWNYEVRRTFDIILIKWIIWYPRIKIFIGWHHQIWHLRCNR